MRESTLYSNIVDTGLTSTVSAFVIRILDGDEVIKARFPYKTERERLKAEESAKDFVTKERKTRHMFPVLLNKDGTYHVPRIRSSFDESGDFYVDEKIIGVIRVIKQPSAKRREEGSAPEICYRVVWRDYWNHDKPKKKYKDFYAGKIDTTSQEDEIHALCTAILFRYEWEQSVRTFGKFNTAEFTDWRAQTLYPASWFRDVTTDPYIK